MTPTVLAEIRDDVAGEAYPRHLLERCDDALVLFAGGFHGKQDAYWIQDAGVEATCVDLRPEGLKVMRSLYPSSWDFVVGEAFEFMDSAVANGLKWDLVSIDCPTGSFERCANLIDRWCELARVAVVLGTSTWTELVVPEGWALTDFRHRSNYRGGVYWAVLERE